MTSWLTCWTPRILYPELNQIIPERDPKVAIMIHT